MAYAEKIGSSASHYLVEGMATAGGGTSIFVGPKENMSTKVLHQLKNAIQPCLTDVTITWLGLENPKLNKEEIETEKTLLGYGKPKAGSLPVDESPGFIQVKEKILPIFDGSQLVVFGIFPRNVQPPSGVQIVANSPDGPLSITISVSHRNELTFCQPGMLHKLGAIQAIQELEMKVTDNTDRRSTESLRQEIIRLGCQYGLASRYTTFVAVDKETEKSSDENWAMQSRYVPSQIPHDWHGGDGDGHEDDSYDSTIDLMPDELMLSVRCCRRQINVLEDCNTDPFENDNVSVPFADCSESAKSEDEGRENNMGQVSRMVGNLRNVALDMASEIESQNLQIDYITMRAASNEVRISCAKDYGQKATNETKMALKYSGRRRSLSVVAGAIAKGISRLVRRNSEVVVCNTDAKCLDSEQFRDIPENWGFSQERTLHAIIDTQYFNGSFPLNQEFAHAIGQKLQILEKEANKGRWEAQAWSTALAVTYLTQKLADWHDSWELVETKAREWLLENHSEVFESLFSAARTFLLKI